MQRCQFPPCKPLGQRLNIIVEYPLCKKTFNHAWQDEQGNWKNFVWEEPCNIDLYYCQYIMAVCFDMDNGKYISSIWKCPMLFTPETTLTTARA